MKIVLLSLISPFFITNLMGHNLIIIVVQNLIFIGLYGINMNIIHLVMLFEP